MAIGTQPWCLHINLKMCFVGNSFSSHLLSQFFHKINCKLPIVALTFLPASAPALLSHSCLVWNVTLLCDLIPPRLHNPAQVTPSVSFSANQPLLPLNSCPTKGSDLLFGPCYILLCIVLPFIFINLLERYTVMFNLQNYQHIDSVLLCLFCSNVFKRSAPFYSIMKIVVTRTL